LAVQAKPANVPDWRPYPIGSNGLYLELPKAPDPPKVTSSTTTTGVYTGPMAVDVREIPYGGGPYAPDAGSRQLLEFVNAQHAGSTGTIERRLVDGFEARLLRTIFKNAGFLNHRDVLVIYGADRFWVVDTVAAENEKDQIARVIDTAKIELPRVSTIWRQHLGKMRVAFNFGAEQIKPKFKETPNDPDIVHEENSLVNFSGGLLAFLEDTAKTRVSTLEEMKLPGIAQSFLDGVGESLKLKLTATVRDSYRIAIDGTPGMHLLFDVTASGSDKTLLCDFLALSDDKLFWSVILLSDPQSESARLVRAHVVNSIRRE
jgi:hypothetical protein